ncbi:hypothetical protein GQX74_004004 [Glossina fuscipes]|nr:hypothetical protein GQX74_004004 [Glossina fuscipes]
MKAFSLPHKCASVVVECIVVAVDDSYGAADWCKSDCRDQPVTDCLLYLPSLLFDGVAVTATVLVDFLCWDELVQDIVLHVVGDGAGDAVAAESIAVVVVVVVVLYYNVADSHWQDFQSFVVHYGVIDTMQLTSRDSIIIKINLSHIEERDEQTLIASITQFCDNKLEFSIDIISGLSTILSIKRCI